MLSADLTRYVALHRKRGLKFDQQERLLLAFVTFAEAKGDDRLIAERVVQWSATGSSPRRGRAGYDTVRRFAEFLAAEDPAHDVPPAGALGRGRPPRPCPHLLSTAAIAEIMEAALGLPPKGSISPHTYSAIFGLLAATGMRVSEALAIQLGDITTDGLIIRSGKFGKSRLLPLHPTTCAALKAYLVLRSRHRSACDDLFVVRTGRAPSKAQCYRIFVRLARELGHRGPRGIRGPRLHDLRHSFAVRSLEGCAHDREAVAHHMAALSTYLGHADIANTYWYLEATPALLGDVAAATEAHFAGAVS